MREAIYRCGVMHRRLFPTRYRFNYTVFSLFLDIDRVDALAARLALFSYNRFNVLSFHDRDHGPRDGSALRPWLTKLLETHGVHGVDGRCFLLCMPRLFGYVFNPLSIYYCFDSQERLRADRMRGEKHLLRAALLRAARAWQSDALPGVAATRQDVSCLAIHGDRRPLRVPPVGAR